MPSTDSANPDGSDSACSCVPALTAPADRLAALRDLIATEVEPLVTLTHLLRLCRDEHATLWEHHADTRCRARVAALVGQVASALPDPGERSSLTAPARDALGAALAPSTEVPAVVVGHGLAELLDACFGHSFTDWFRQRSPYQPAVGDPIPLDHPDLPRIISMAPTAPPWRLANRLDETRRVRLAGGWATQFKVVFDYGAFDALAGLITADTVVATCHPNKALAEFELPDDRRQPAFPVRPADINAQRDRIERLLNEACDAGASVVVLPELCVTEELADELEAWVRRPGPMRLLVAGSFHHAESLEPARRANRALAWVRDHPAPLLCDKHSPADRPALEDITPVGWPEVRVHVTADGWHLVIAICRDLLNPHAVHALTEAGANLVLAPSMSETLLPFGGPVAQLVGSGQAVVAVANNPADWTDTDHPDGSPTARALFGHPGLPRLTRLVQAPDDNLGLGVLRVGVGHVSWRPTGPEPVSIAVTEAGVAADGPPPAWLGALRSLVLSTTAPTTASVTLRPAAVLVVLIDRPDGPHVLLTGRALDLTNYPGQIVFPGGAADANDRDLVETALREAREETGLEASSVHVIGALSPFGLRESGFLVTPVLAWSNDPQFTQLANPAEVTTVRTVPIAVAAARDGAVSSPSDPEQVNIGVMTGTIIELLAARLAR